MCSTGFFFGKAIGVWYSVGTPGAVYFFGNAIDVWYSVDALPGAARQPLTFFASPKKVSKERRPRTAAPSGFPQKWRRKRETGQTRCAQTGPVSDPFPAPFLRRPLSGVGQRQRQRPLPRCASIRPRYASGLAMMVALLCCASTRPASRSDRNHVTPNPIPPGSLHQHSVKWRLAPEYCPQ